MQKERSSDLQWLRWLLCILLVRNDRSHCLSVILNILQYTSINYCQHLPIISFVFYYPCAHSKWRLVFMFFKNMINVFFIVFKFGATWWAYNFVLVHVRFIDSFPRILFVCKIASINGTKLFEHQCTISSIKCIGCSINLLYCNTRRICFLLVSFAFAFIIRLIANCYISGPPRPKCLPLFPFLILPKWFPLSANACSIEGITTNPATNTATINWFCIVFLLNKVNISRTSIIEGFFTISIFVIVDMTIVF